MKELWMIRHGESRGNAGLRTPNTIENGLTGRGFEQADDLARFLEDKNVCPNLIIHSSYIRTYETMMPFVQGKNFNIEEWPIHEFTYLSNEKYLNSTYEERIGPKNEYWKRMDPDYRDGGQAESYNDMIIRVERMIRRVLMGKYNFVMAFSHGQFIKATILLLLNEGLNKKLPTMEEFYGMHIGMEVPNVGIVKFKFTDNEGVLINAMTHHYV